MAFHADKAKTEVRHFLLKLLKARCTPVKQDRKPPAQKKSKEWSAAERDRNEIPICIIRGHLGTRQGGIPGYTRSLSWKTSKTRCTPEQRDWREFWWEILAAAHYSCSDFWEASWGWGGALRSGNKSPAFGKPCLWLREARHFRHFRRFHRVWGAKPFSSGLWRELIASDKFFTYRESFCNKYVYTNYEFHA